MDYVPDFSLEMAKTLQTTSEMSQSPESFANICQGKTPSLCLVQFHGLGSRKWWIVGGQTTKKNIFHKTFTSWNILYAETIPIRIAATRHSRPFEDPTTAENRIPNPFEIRIFWRSVLEWFGFGMGGTIATAM